jgi:quinol monooxygenase YgiN
MTILAKATERHLLVTVRSQPAHRPRVQELLQALVPLVRSEPGCLYYHLFAHTDDPNAFVLVAGWADEAAVAAHPTHAAVPGVLALIRPLLAAGWEVLSIQRLSENPP